MRGEQVPRDSAYRPRWSQLPQFESQLLFLFFVPWFAPSSFILCSFPFLANSLL
jgi:hypothetical protein